MLFKAVAESRFLEFEKFGILESHDVSSHFNRYVLKYKNLLQETEHDPATLTVYLNIHVHSIKITNNEEKIVSAMRLIFDRFQKQNHPFNQFGKLEIFLKDNEESGTVGEYYTKNHAVYPGVIALNLKYLFKELPPNPFELGGVPFREYLDAAMRVLHRELGVKEFYESIPGRTFYLFRTLDNPLFTKVMKFFKDYLFLSRSRVLFSPISNLEKRTLFGVLLRKKKIFDEAFVLSSHAELRQIWKNLCQQYQVDQFFITISRLRF